LHTAGLLLAIGITLGSGGTGADEHLLAGARAFREGRFEQALVEFSVAQGLGSQDAAPYAAASLVKLGRAEEAVEAFGGGDGPGRDALIDYYRAMACYQARLYVCADRILAGLGDRTGPRIAGQAVKVRAAIAAELAKEPSQTAVDWYHARCQAASDGRRPILAAAYCREAIALAERREDRYRRSEAAAKLAKMGDGSSPGAKR
jgi:tetratricopeptide (TPR) repeat protein